MVAIHKALLVVIAIGAVSLTACAQESDQQSSPEPEQAVETQAEAGAEAPARTESQQAAYDIVMGMADFLAGLDGFSVSTVAGFDVVQDNGQKIQFVEARDIHLDRPNRLLIEEEGPEGSGQSILFDGEWMTIRDEDAGVYAQVEQPGEVDHAIVYFVRDLGMRIPLSPLLTTWAPQELERRIFEIEYVEMTYVFGQPTHHVAARTPTVDFQAWITDGEEPLPLRVILTYPEEGQPQYWAQFSDWDLQPAFEDERFVFSASEGMIQIPFEIQFYAPPPDAAPAVTEGE